MKNILLVAILAPLLFLNAQNQLAAEPTASQLTAKKVLVLGNSITLHGPAPAIGWTGNWGMAASSKEKDFVHLLLADLSNATGKRPKTKVKNIAKFEREYVHFDLAKELKAELDFEADLVVIAIGENVTEPKTDEQQANFAKACTQLLDLLNRSNQPAIFVRSSFWPNETKDRIMQKASIKAGATYVDISHLGNDLSHQANSERTIEHAGVAAHPGDKGMRAIADALFEAIQKAK